MKKHFLIFSLLLFIFYNTFSYCLAITATTTPIPIETVKPILIEVEVPKITPKELNFDEYCKSQCNSIFPGYTECKIIKQADLLEGKQLSDPGAIKILEDNLNKTCPIDKYHRVEIKEIIPATKDDLTWCCYGSPNKIDTPPVNTDTCANNGCEKPIPNETEIDGPLFKCTDINKKLKFFYLPESTACCCPDNIESNFQQCKAQVTVYDEETGRETETKEVSHLCSKNAQCCEGQNNKQPCCSNKDQCLEYGCCAHASFACPNKKNCCPIDSTCCSSELFSEINTCCPKGSKCVQSNDGTVGCEQVEGLL